MNANELHPFHLFHYREDYFVINVETMQADAVDQHTFSRLEKLTAKDSLAELTPVMQIKLRQPPITYMSLLVTQSCNLRCVYCYEDKKSARMNDATAFRAVDWLIKKSEAMRSLNIIFFGGEPLLNFPLIEAVVDYAKDAAKKSDKYVSFTLITNGTLLDDEINLFLQKHQIRVTISFDGLKELQDSQRPFASGSGSYDRVIPKIKNLLKLMPQTASHAVIMGDNSPETIKDALQELGFHRVTVALNSQSPFTKGNQAVNTSDRDTRAMLSALEEEAKSWYDLIKKRDIASIKKLTGRSNLYLALLSLMKQSKKRFFCGAGQSMVAVNPSGDIYLCHRFVDLDDYRIGSIHEDELNLESFCQSPVDANDTCKQCFAKYYCGGGCKHDHLTSCGSVNEPEQRMCLLKQRELELAATVVSRLSNEDRNWLVKENLFPPKPCPLDF